MNITEWSKQGNQIIVVNKNERSCAIIDIAILGDITVSRKEKKKIEIYQGLKREIKRM